MSDYHGDIALGSTIDIPFPTKLNGVMTTLGGSPAISAYVDNGTTEITAGITLTVDHDGRTGRNLIRVVATSGNGFASGTNVSLDITTGTVAGVNVIGPVACFSIDNRNTGSGLSAAGVRAAIGMASADLDTQLDALPTNAELSTALGTADDAVLAAIAALNNLSSAGAQSAAAAALLAYGASTGTAPTAAAISAQIASDATTTPLKVNVKKMNDTTVLGTGVSGDKWRG
jgi:hypothetical protein